MEEEILKMHEERHMGVCAIAREFHIRTTVVSDVLKKNGIDPRKTFICSRSKLLKFWDRTSPDENGCIVWTGKRNSRGYGRIKLFGKNTFAHRVALFLEKPEMLKNEKRIVMHMCDNPPCVNIKHLKLCEQKDNVSDMFKKGRDNHARGSNVNTSKLTTSIVEHIRRQPIRHGFYSKIGREYGVSHSAIRAIINRKSWAHIK